MTRTPDRFAIVNRRGRIVANVYGERRAKLRAKLVRDAKILRVTGSVLA